MNDQAKKSDVRHLVGSNANRDEARVLTRTRALSRRGSDRIEGGTLPLYAYLSDDPHDDPRGPVTNR